MVADMILGALSSQDEAYTIVLLSIVSGVLACVSAVYPVLLLWACKGDLTSGTKSLVTDLPA
jgi:hypothetical protein